MKAKPLDLPVCCDYDGVGLRGRIVRAYPNEIVVALDFPEDYRGESFRHIPYFAMQKERRFMVDGQLTPRAIDVAHEVMVEIYERERDRINSS